MQCLKLLASLFGILGWLLQLIALGSAHWLTFGHGSGSETSIGFNEICGEVWTLTGHCSVLPNEYSTSMVSASAVCLGVSVGLCSLAILITWVSCCCCSKTRTVAIAAMVLFCLSALFNLLCVVLYATDLPNKYPEAEYGHSFFVAVIAVVCSALSALLVMQGRRRDSDSHPLVVKQEPTEERKRKVTQEKQHNNIVWTMPKREKPVDTSSDEENDQNGPTDRPHKKHKRSVVPAMDRRFKLESQGIKTTHTG